MVPDPSSPADPDHRSGRRALLLTFTVLALLMLGWMLLGYLPPHARMFDALGGKLPAVSVVMITLSQYVQANVLTLIVVLAGALFGLHYATRTAERPLLVVTSILMALCMLLTGLGYLAVQYPLAELDHAIRGR